MAQQISCDPSVKPRHISSMEEEEYLVTICSAERSTEENLMLQFQQELKGISQVMLDAALVSEMLVSFEHVVPNDVQSSSALVFEWDRTTIIMDGFSTMVNWTAKTVGCVSQVSSQMP